MLDGILIGVISGIILLGLGSLAWLAYHHSAEFKRWFMWLVAALLGVGIGMNSWDQGVSHAMNAVVRSQPRLAAQASAAIDPLQIDAKWYFIIGVGGNVYLLFLFLYVARLKPPANRSRQSGRSQKPAPKRKAP